MALLDPVIKPKTTEAAVKNNDNNRRRKRRRKKRSNRKRKRPIYESNLTVGKVLQAKEDDAWSEKLYCAKS